MEDTKQYALIVSLQQVIDELEQKSSPALYGGLLLASELIIKYFKHPATEITVREMRDWEGELPHFLFYAGGMSVEITQKLYREC
jgi:hypothetical protein